MKVDIWPWKCALAGNEGTMLENHLCLDCVLAVCVRDTSAKTAGSDLAATYSVYSIPECCISTKEKMKWTKSKQK